MKNERDIDSYEKTFTERPKETYSLETDYLVTHSEIEVIFVFNKRKRKS